MHCTERCPLACAKSCDPVTGDCRKCAYGKGDKCLVDCSDPNDKDACALYCPSNCLSWCSAVNHHCDVCDFGRKPPFCNETCDLGFYGKNCKNKCSSRCKDNVCDPKDGVCDECVTGHVGKMCNGKCIEGLYGDRCMMKCPETCLGNKCHYRDGKCQSCAPGYTGALCTQFCKEGKFGNNCQESCSKSCGGVCNPFSGECGKCEPGYRGVFCNETCEEGKFGERCGNICSEYCSEKICHHVSGECSKCVSTRTGPFCSEIAELTFVEEFKDAIYIFLCVLAPVVLVVLLVVLFKLKGCRDKVRLKKQKRILEKEKSDKQEQDKGGAKYATINRGVKATTLFLRNKEQLSPLPSPNQNKQTAITKTQVPIKDPKQTKSKIPKENTVGFGTQDSIKEKKKVNGKNHLHIPKFSEIARENKTSESIEKQPDLEIREKSSFLLNESIKSDINALYSYAVSSAVQVHATQGDNIANPNGDSVTIESNSSLSIKGTNSQTSQISNERSLSLNKKTDGYKIRECFEYQAYDGKLQPQLQIATGTASTPMIAAQGKQTQSGTLENLQSLSDENNLEFASGSRPLAGQSTDKGQLTLTSNTAVVTSESISVPSNFDQIKISSSTAVIKSPTSADKRDIKNIQISTKTTFLSGPPSFSEKLNSQRIETNGNDIEAKESAPDEIHNHLNQTAADDRETDNVHSFSEADDKETYLRDSFDEGGPYLTDLATGEAIPQIHDGGLYKFSDFFLPPTQTFNDDRDIPFIFPSGNYPEPYQLGEDFIFLNPPDYSTFVSPDLNPTEFKMTHGVTTEQRDVGSTTPFSPTESEEVPIVTLPRDLARSKKPLIRHVSSSALRSACNEELRSLFHGNISDSGVLRKTKPDDNTYFRNKQAKGLSKKKDPISKTTSDLRFNYDDDYFEQSTFYRNIAKSPKNLKDKHYSPAHSSDFYASDNERMSPTSNLQLPRVQDPRLSSRLGEHRETSPPTKSLRIFPSTTSENSVNDDNFNVPASKTTDERPVPNAVVENLVATSSYTTNPNTSSTIVGQTAGLTPNKASGHVIRCATTRQCSPVYPHVHPGPRPLPTPPPRGYKGLHQKNTAVHPSTSDISDNSSRSDET